MYELELLGQHRYKFDRDGRIRLPGRWLDSFDGQRIYLTAGEDGSLNVFPDQSFKRVVDQVRSFAPGNEVGRALTRMVLGWAESTEPDGRGRITIPALLRRVAGLGESVVVLGLFDRIQIWDARRWETIQESFDPTRTSWLEVRRSAIVGPDGEPIQDEPRLWLPEPDAAAEPADEQTGAGVVRRIRRTIEDLLLRSPVTAQDLHQLSPRDFEELIAELLSAQGYGVERTPMSHDGGVDLWVAREDSLGKFLYAVQCKRNAPERPVRVDVVRELVGVVDLTGATAGILVTSSSFTKVAARTVALERLRYRISLHDHRAIDEWIRSYPR